MVTNVFDIDDNVIESTDEHGVTVTMTYDDAGRMRTRTFPDTGGEGFVYQDGFLLAHTNFLGTTGFLNDPAGRKVAETNANSDQIEFLYDPAGNLLSLTNGNDEVTSWGYDEFGRVTNKVDAAAVTILRYQYDANGRLTNRWSKAKGNTGYAYDAVGNLKEVDYATSTDLEFYYDANNRLTNMLDAVGTTRYSYSSVGLLLAEDGPWDNDTVSYSSGKSVNRE